MATHKFDLNSLESLPSNSNKSRAEQQEKKEVTPVVSHPVVRKKQTMGKKFVDTFFSESVSNVKNYVIDDVLMPNIKDTLLDIIFQGLSMLITGDPGRGKARPKHNQSAAYKPDKPSYASYYDEPEKNRKYYASSRRDSYSLDDLIVGDKGEAEKILDGMIDILESYKVVTVGDLYQLCELSTEPSDFNYGWTNLEQASTKRVNGGYLIDLPRAKDIRNN